MSSLTKTLDLYLVKKAPALPKGIKELVVKLAPWLTIAIVVFTIPAILSLFGFGAMMYGTTYGSYVMAKTGFNYSLPILFILAIWVLKLLAIPGLMKRSVKGWNYLYYAVLVEAANSVVNFQLLSLVVSTTISLYILFQIRSYYK
jgi:hypothetical protein